MKRKIALLIGTALCMDAAIDAQHRFIEQKKGLPIKSDEESFIVAEIGEISNFDILKDMLKIIVFITIR